MMRVDVDSSTHPMLRMFRPSVATREIELLADAINSSLDVSYRGLSVYAYARYGKTEGVAFLTKHQEWLGVRRAALRMISISSPEKRDGNFISNLLSCLEVRVSPRATLNDRFRLLLTYLVEACHLSKSRAVILFVDEAQRLKPADYEHLVSIDNSMTMKRYYVFYVFLNQRDVTGYTNEVVSRSEHPPHVYGRFLTRKHEMSGVKCPEDASYILDNYDSRTEWPIGSGISFSRHFAPSGFEAGWRLAHHANRMWEIAEKIRTEHRLASHWTWPMKSFEGAVAYLLTVIAPRHTDFSGFSDDEIEEAIIAAGYAELELSRETYTFHGDAQ